VDVSARPGVIHEVPSRIIRVIEKHNVIAVPEPVIDKFIFEGSNHEIVAAKPEALRTTALQSESVPAANTAGKAPMLPRMIEGQSGITAAGGVSNPLAVRMNVRSVGMARLVAIIAGLCPAGTTSFLSGAGR